MKWKHIKIQMQVFLGIEFSAGEDFLYLIGQCGVIIFSSYI